jgi:Ca2+/Na+ antiporter
MKQFLIYWVWPNPGSWVYTDPKVLSAIILSLVLVFGSFALSAWRRKQSNPQTRSLSSSWSSASFWFGLIALFLIVCRVEYIQFLAMRALWLVWFASLALYIVFQVLQFRRRHYTILGRPTIVDVREKYLPRKK